jgi:hypothetical protein
MTFVFYVARQMEDVMAKIKTRVAADNVPESVIKRLIATALRDMVSESALVRQCLEKGLPPWKDVKNFYPKA